HKKHSGIFLPHILKTNDVLIAAILLPRFLPSITSVQVLHDITLQKMYTGPRPDAWIKFVVNNEYSVCLWVEIDMGTMDQRPFRRKINQIVQFAKTEYQKVYLADNITVVYLNPLGEKRRDTTLSW